MLETQNKVHGVAPDAQVRLFGSRANGTATAESDWDVLIITRHALSRDVERKIQEQVFPLSVPIGSFIQLLIVSEKDWKHNPKSRYSNNLP